jgi:hypothetical protein
MKHYIWTAVIDENTCDECRLLNDSQISKSAAKDFHPPRHGKDKDHKVECRCTLVKSKEIESN